MTPYMTPYICGVAFGRRFVGWQNVLSFLSPVILDILTPYICGVASRTQYVGWQYVLSVFFQTMPTTFCDTLHSKGRTACRVTKFPLSAIFHYVRESKSPITLCHTVFCVTLHSPPTNREIARFLHSCEAQDPYLLYCTMSYCILWHPTLCGVSQNTSVA